MADCRVPGCPAVGDGKAYTGMPSCLQAYSGDPVAWEKNLDGRCILRETHASIDYHVSPPAPSSDKEMVEAIDGIKIERHGETLCVVDTNKAEPEVNWPGELLSEHKTYQEAKHGRIAAIIALIRRSPAPAPDDEVEQDRKLRCPLCGRLVEVHNTAPALDGTGFRPLTAEESIMFNMGRRSMTGKKDPLRATQGLALASDNLDYIVFKILGDNPEFSARYRMTVENAKDLAQSILAASKSAPAGDGWRDIASAPRDGLVDLWANGTHYANCFRDPANHNDWRTSRPTGHLYHITKPTHWRPLPIPSAQGETK